MKTYIWTELNCLTDYDHGFAIGVATSLDEAILQVASFCEKNFGWEEFHTSQLVEEMLRSEPSIIEGPTGFAMMGSC